MRVQIPPLTFQRHFKTLIFALIISVLLLSGAGFLARSLQSEPPTSVMEGQLLANSMVNAIGQSGRIGDISGGYFPTEGLFIYSTVKEGAGTNLTTWIGTQLLSFSEQFATLPSDEVLIWVIDVDGQQLVLRAPLNRANETATHSFVTHATTLLAAEPTLPDEVSAPAEETEPSAVEPLEETAVLQPEPELIDEQGRGTSEIGNDITLNFEEETGEWLILDGEWQFVDGLYRQQSQEGFDFITMLGEPTPQNYVIQTEFRQLEGPMGGGVIFNAPFADRRGGAQIIDLDNEGRFLRWGHYLSNDNFVFDGGVALSQTVADGQWHTLQVELNDTTAVFILDDQPVGETPRLGEGAYAGLVTSLTVVEFDNFSISDLSGEDVPETAVLPDDDPEAEEVAEPIEPVAEIVPAPLSADNDEQGQATLNDFENGAASWQPLSGNWLVNNGSYIQDDSSGFDYISMLNISPLTNYSFEARIKSLDGQLGGGFIYHAPTLDQRQGAQLIDFIEAGSILRWGHYDNDGAYVFVGSAAINPPVADGEWHQLRLGNSGTQTEIFLNGRSIAQIENLSAGGYVGLYTSQAQVEFDDVNLITAPVDAALASTEDFIDNFSGTLDSWVALGGSWELVNEELQQTELGGVDQPFLSSFYGRNYTMQARFRLVEGEMGGGFLFNARSREEMSSSQMIAFTQQGNALQWGHFDEDGVFVFEGITDVRQNAPEEWHTLKVSVVDGIATFVFDNDLLIESINLTYENGYVGLINSLGQLAVDDFTVTLDTTVALTNQALAPVERAYAFETAENPDWTILAGDWQFNEGSYEQRQQSEFDRIARLDLRLIGDYRFSSSMRHIEGEMGGGLIFNMQQADSKAASQMVSFTANGEFLQWGHFDEAGVFTYEGGTPVPSAQNGEWHQLAIITTNSSFAIELNGEVVADDLPLTYQNGFVGLFDGLSWVAYDDVALTGFSLPVRQADAGEAVAEEAEEETDIEVSD